MSLQSRQSRSSAPALTRQKGPLPTATRTPRPLRAPAIRCHSARGPPCPRPSVGADKKLTGSAPGRGTRTRTQRAPTAAGAQTTRAWPSQAASSPPLSVTQQPPCPKPTPGAASSPSAAPTGTCSAAGPEPRGLARSAGRGSGHRHSQVQTAAHRGKGRRLPSLAFCLWELGHLELSLHGRRSASMAPSPPREPSAQGSSGARQP